MTINQLPLKIYTIDEIKKHKFLVHRLVINFLLIIVGILAWNYLGIKFYTDF